MKKIIMTGVFLSLFSCQEKVELKSPSLIKSTGGSSASDFSDFSKKGDESCDDEEALKKKLIPEKPKAFKLQGGDAGCDIDKL